MLRRLTGSIVVAAALAAAAPASAQRASLAERVASLEQQAANNRGNVDLLNQVTQLKNEVQALRAQLEELQQQATQAAASGRSQYLDLDGRLNRIEGGAPVAPGTQAVTPAPAALPEPREAAPSVHGDPGSLSKGEGERAAYDAAFDALKAGRYAESAQLFQGFVEAFPNGTYTPNALYWLGESYYVTQNYALAQAQFQALLDRYPTHDKAPGALLKVGLAQYGLKELEAAERTLADVSARYPGTDAARTADDRLRAIRIAGAR